MKQLTSFSLEKHTGPYKSWPALTRLFFEGADTGRPLRGYVIEAQFSVGSRYLIVTTDDCPFEETTRFHLLDERFRLLSRKTKWAPFGSWWVRTVEPLDASSFTVEFTDEEHWILAVRDRRPLGIGSLLTLTRVE